ncbi:hypothetical protein LINPERPRIM_LOCUS17872 [Linum perenne]
MSSATRMMMFYATASYEPHDVYHARRQILTESFSDVRYISHRMTMDVVFFSGMTQNYS